MAITHSLGQVMQERANNIKAYVVHLISLPRVSMEVANIELAGIAQLLLILNHQ